MTIQDFKFIVHAMKKANKLQCHEVFMDIELDEEEECINFDIATSFLVSATHLADLFNMTLWIEPSGDKIKYSFIP